MTPLICAGVPVHRHREDGDIGFKENRRDKIEIVVKGTGFSRAVARFTGMAAADFHHGGVKSRYAVTFCFRCFDKGVRHGKAVSVFARASCDDSNFFTHIFFLPARFFFLLFFLFSVLLFFLNRIGILVICFCNAFPFAVHL